MRQNEDPDVVERRRNRVALRALEGREVVFPYRKVANEGRKKGKGMEVQARVEYTTGTLEIERNSVVRWRGYNYASGFGVVIKCRDGQGLSGDGTRIYQQRLTIDAEAIGIPPDFSLSEGLINLFKFNYELVQERLPGVEAKLKAHRSHFGEEMKWKEETLSYGFLLNVLAESDLNLEELDRVLREGEKEGKVKELVGRYRASLILLEERMAFVSGSLVLQFWYTLWDDLWRRNSGGIAKMREQPEEFSPYYKSSICVSRRF